MPQDTLSVAQALATIARAAQELRDAGVVEVAPFLSAYRALVPVAHPGAASRALDLAFLAAAGGLGDALLGAELLQVEATTPRAPPYVSGTGAPMAALHVAPGVEATADALALFLGLGLEAAKLQALLDDGAGDDPLSAAAYAAGISASEIAASLGGDGDEAARVLSRITAGGAVRRVTAPALARQALPLDDVVFDVAADDEGPLFVLAGATERLQDLLSPWVRRLQAPLARVAGSDSSDELYAALPAVLAADSRVHEERLDAEAKEGFTPCGGAVVVRFERVDAARADERARPLLRALKQSRARAVLCDRHPDTLTQVLMRVGRRVRVVAVLGEALGGRSRYPDVVVDALTGHPLDLDNALADPEEARDEAAVVISPPSLGLSPRAFLEHGVGCAPLLAPLLLAAAHARAGGILSRRARLAAATFPPGDSAAASEVALRCLARMAGTTPLPRRQGRRT